MESTSTPVRGTRPRNRRALILAAASELFVQKGYPQVGMNEVAEAMAVRPSALYRHFPSKSELLREAVVASIQPVLDSIVQATDGDPGQLIPALARAVLDHREDGVLWQRESRHLPPAVRSGIANQVKTAISRKLTSEKPELTTLHADLRAWSMFAVMSSVTLHPNRLRRGEEEELVIRLAQTVWTTPLPRIEATQRSGGAVSLQRTRREALLAASIRLFTARGFDAVSLEDIGAEVGIAGPGIYRHFNSKAEMLTTALNRANEVLWMDLSRALAEAADASDALQRLLKSYIHFSLSTPEFLQLAVSELPHLPEDDARRLVAAKDDYATDWVSLIQDASARTDSIVIEAQLHAAFNVISNVARTPHLRSIEGIEGILELMSTRLLATDVSERDGHPER